MQNDKSERGAEQTPEPPLDWSGADAAMIHPVDVFWLQASKKELILSAGKAYPSAATSHLDSDGVQRYIDKHGLKAHGIVRLALSRSVIKPLIEALESLEEGV